MCQYWNAARYKIYSYCTLITSSIKENVTNIPDCRQSRSTFIDLVLSKEQREQRQYKRQKNHGTKNVESIPKKVDQNLNIETDGLEVERRLNSPVLLNELKEIDIRRKSFMEFVADRTIKYFSSRPQVSITIQIITLQEKIRNQYLFLHFTFVFPGI